MMDTPLHILVAFNLHREMLRTAALIAELRAIRSGLKGEEEAIVNRNIETLILDRRRIVDAINATTPKLRSN
jgi:hypothetical protein